MKSFRGIFAGLAIAVALASPALAADLPVKAPASPLPSWLQYPSGSGIFFGVGASGLGGTAGSDIGSGAVFGGTIALSVGYTGKVGNGGFWFIEQSAKADAVNSGGSTVSFKPTNFELETRLAIGANAGVVANWAQAVGVGGVAMPTIPVLPGANIVSSNPYAFISLHVLDASANVGTAVGTSLLTSWGAGVGNLYRWSNGIVVDTSIEYVHQSTGMLLGAPAINVKFGDKFEAMASIKF